MLFFTTSDFSPSPVTATPGCCFSFGSISSLFLELLSTLLQQHIGHLPTWRIHVSVLHLFACSYCSWGSQGKNIEVVCHSLLQWTTFCQNSLPCPVSLEWSYMAWLIVSLSLTRLWSMWSVWLVFCYCGFHYVFPLMDKDKRLVETSLWERLTLGESGSFLMGGAMLSKSLIQFSVNGCLCSLYNNLLFPPCCLAWGQTMVEVTWNLCTHCCVWCPWPHSKPLLGHTSARDSWTLIDKSGLVSRVTLLLSPGC